MATLSDRMSINTQIEHLQSKYVGTGHPDISRFEWALNIHRDSYASYIGHHPMLAYFSTVENESIGRVKYDFLQKMLLPCGIPPKPQDAEEEEEEEMEDQGKK
ncbi:splicing factor 3B subunit 10-domain-containing protein [Dunaliella salina]|uniref:Splicing factor 3B subunit 10-domain-containing protein n=1 Tax=Dunaliella salina TaxID=3046 RepID=A0ABQ7GY68_DUNSA|nr:splicing factor 3B subunit 10-domain-containing protein [Dunaliella salina]|eukprot:KAF5839554.1 splicing factor 3B subunit 10-domain-containing protein [Dunaliella salina]